MKDKCINPDCQSTVRTRGLCNNCYSIATHLIKEGLTTWDKLMADGKVLPRKPHGQKMSKTRAWLLDRHPITLEPTTFPTEQKDQP